MENRITVGIPSSDMVHASFMTSLIRLILQSKNINMDFFNHRSSRITANRNEIIKFAKEKNSTHVLFIDADMTFPPYALAELLGYDRDIVCATATKREEGPNDPIGVPHSAGDNVTKTRLIQMDFVGMPFMLIKMSVFDKLNEPYFAEPIINDELIPEDNYFCQEVRMAGIEIWCDLAISMDLGHLGIKEYKIAPVKEPNLKLVKVA